MTFDCIFPESGTLTRSGTLTPWLFTESVIRILKRPRQNSVALVLDKGGRHLRVFFRLNSSADGSISFAAVAEVSFEIWRVDHWEFARTFDLGWRNTAEVYLRSISANICATAVIWSPASDLEQR
jgi:hypothetical protein